MSGGRGRAHKLISDNLLGCGRGPYVKKADDVPYEMGAGFDPDDGFDLRQPTERYSCKHAGER
jgi:hypothetical protein